MKLNLKRKIAGWFKHVVYTAYLAFCKCRFGPNVRVIALSRFKYATVDEEDYERLKKFNWRARRFDKIWYAVRWVRKKEQGDKTVVWMHRAVMEAPEGKLIDHRNHNGLDNRKENLRPATYSQNMQNRRKVQNKCSSRYKGVMYRKGARRVKRWRASIKSGGRMIELGMYDKETEAAKAYDAAATKYFGEYACLNFPERKKPRWLTGLINLTKSLKLF